MTEAWNSTDKGRIWVIFQKNPLVVRKWLSFMSKLKINQKWKIIIIRWESGIWEEEIHGEIQKPQWCPTRVLIGQGTREQLCYLTVIKGKWINTISGYIISYMDNVVDICICFLSTFHNYWMCSIQQWVIIVLMNKSMNLSNSRQFCPFGSIELFCLTISMFPKLFDILGIIKTIAKTITNCNSNVLNE